MAWNDKEIERVCLDEPDNIEVKNIGLEFLLQYQIRLKK